MKNRLEAARELLRNDGVLFVSIDDREQSYLKILMDEIFGRENFVANFIWKKKQGGGNDSKNVIVEHEYVLAYAINIDNISLNLDTLYPVDENTHPFVDNWWSYWLVTLDKSSIRFSDNLVFEITDPHGNVYLPRIIKWKQSCWRWGRDKVIKEYSKLVFKDGKVYTKYYKQDGVIPKTLLIDAVYGRTNSWGIHLFELFWKKAFAYPKPESLIHAIITIATNPWDIVLDYHLGSGTTAAVAHKMGRRWIGVEQMEYIDTIAKERLKKVLDGEQGGISKNVGWQGGGDFVYLELKTFNGYFLDEIEKATSKETLKKIYNDMKRSAFLKFFFDPDDFENEESENGKKYAQLTLAEQKEKLKGVLDMNHIYLNAGNYDETVHTISELDKSLTAKFYGEK